MQLTALWPFLLINLACFIAAWAIARGNSFYREEVRILTTGRVQMIDGLRGWLALGVFFSHTITTYGYYTHGRWDDVDVPFRSFTGGVGVSLFFMITGFLFWSRVLRSKGNLDARALYLSRLRRIVPMYLASVLLSMAVVATLSGFVLRVGPAEFLRELRPWLSFGFMDVGDINGVKDAHIINAVYWTLAFEWGFYVALPFLALFARGPLQFVLMAVAFVFCLREPVTLNFMGGMLAAIIADRGFLHGRLSGHWLTPVPLACLAAVFTLHSPYGIAPAALLLVFFLFVVHGNSLFGLLASNGARLLGTVSYSIYLIHCITLFVVMRSINAYLPIAGMSLVEYWSWAGCAALLAVVLSSITYRFVEHPFIHRSPVPVPARSTPLRASPPSPAAVGP